MFIFISIFIVIFIISKLRYSLKCMREITDVAIAKLKQSETQSDLVKIKMDYYSEMQKWEIPISGTICTPDWYNQVNRFEINYWNIKSKIQNDQFFNEKNNS